MAAKADAVGIAPRAGVWTKSPKIKAPEYSGRGAPPKKWDYGGQRPSSVKEVALKAEGWKQVRWREGSKGWLESRFLAPRVQPSHGFVHGDPPHKETWLLVEWPEAEKEPAKCFFCDLPASYTLRRLVRITKCRWMNRTAMRKEASFHCEGAALALPGFIALAPACCRGAAPPPRYQASPWDGAPILLSEGEPPALPGKQQRFDSSGKPGPMNMGFSLPDQRPIR